MHKRLHKIIITSMLLILFGSSGSCSKNVERCLSCSASVTGAILLVLGENKKVLCQMALSGNCH